MRRFSLPFRAGLLGLFLLPSALLAGERSASPQHELTPASTFSPQPGTLRRGNEVAALALAPQGTTIAIARGSADAASGRLQLWDRSPDREGLILNTDTPLLALAFSPDGKTLAAGGADGTVQLRDPGTGNVHRLLHGHSGAVLTLVFTPDGKQLVSAGEDSTLVVWSLATGKQVKVLRGHLDCVRSLTLRSTSAAEGGDLDSFLRSLTAPFQSKSAPAKPSKRSLLLASGSRDQTVKLWDLNTGELVRTLRGHGTEVSHVGFPLGSGQLLTAGRDGMLRLWDIDEGKPIHQSATGLSSLHALACNRNGFERLAVGSRESGLRLLSLQSGQPQPQVLGTAPEGISALAFSSDDRWLVSGGIDGTVKLWEAAQGLRLQAALPLRAAVRETFPILATTCSPDGKTLAVGGEAKVVDLIDAGSGELLHRLKGHEDIVSGLAFSPDSKTLATASFDGTVRLWDVREGRLRSTLTGHKHWVFAVAFCPDGTQLASGGYDQTVRLWDPATGAETGCLRGHGGGVRCLACSPDGKLLASGSSDRRIRLWDLAGGRTRTTLTGHEGMVRTLAFSPDGKTLASGSEDNTVRLWEVETGKETGCYRHQDRVLSVAFGPAGNVLVSGSRDQAIAVLDPTRATLRAILQGHSGGVTSLALSPDSRLISGSTDGTLAVWTSETGNTRPRTQLQVPGGLDRFVALAPDGAGLATAGESNPLTLHRLQMERACKAPQVPAQPVFGLAYSPDGKTLAVGCLDGSIYLCDACTGERKQTLKGYIPQVWCVAFSPDGKSLAAASGAWHMRYNSGSVKLWDLASGKETMSFAGHQGNVYSVSFSPDGKLLATAGWDQTVRVWDVATGKMKHRLHEPPGGPVRFAVFSPVGSVLAGGSWSGTVKLWDPKTGKELASFSTPLPGISCLAFSKDGKTLAAAYNPYTGDFNDPLNGASEEHGGIQLWDVAGRKELRRIETMKGKVLSVAFSPDGKSLVSGGGAGPRFGEVRLWETASGKEIASLDGPTRSVEVVAFAPGGRTVAAGDGGPGGPGEVHVWNLDTELGRRKLKGAQAASVQAVYSPDGRMLATGSEDGKVQLWEVASGKVKKSLAGPTAAITRLAFAADGKTLAAASADSLVHVWDMEQGTVGLTCRDETGTVLDVALAPDGKTLAVCTSKSAEGAPGRIRLWDVGSGKEQESAGMGKNPLCVTFAGNGKLVAIGLAEGVEVWDRARGKRLSWLQGAHAPRTLVFTPDSGSLAAAQDAGGLRAAATVLLWDLSTGKKKTFLAGRSRLVELHFSAEGKILTGVAGDGLVHQWKLGGE